MCIGLGASVCACAVIHARSDASLQVVRLADIKCADADVLSDRLMKTLQEFILP